MLEAAYETAEVVIGRFTRGDGGSNGFDPIEIFVVGKTEEESTGVKDPS